jgi:hypothetical protein
MAANPMPNAMENLEPGGSTEPTYIGKHECIKTAPNWEP